MLDISKFFEKFKKIKLESDDLKNKIVSTVKKISEISLGSEEFMMKDGVIRLITNPIKRNEILMRRDQIISELELLNIKCKDIR